MMGRNATQPKQSPTGKSAQRGVLPNSLHKSPTHSNPPVSTSPKNWREAASGFFKNSAAWLLTGGSSSSLDAKSAPTPSRLQNGGEHVHDSDLKPRNSPSSAPQYPKRLTPTNELSTAEQTDDYKTDVLSPNGSNSSDFLRHWNEELAKETAERQQELYSAPGFVSGRPGGVLGLPSGVSFDDMAVE
eukprot:Platyproteum_vivax@DN5736_c0_g1_i3.p2